MHYAKLFITHGRKLYLLNELIMALYIILNSLGFYFTVEVVNWFKYSNSLFYQCKSEKTELSLGWYIGFGVVYNLLEIVMSHIRLFYRKDLIINILLGFRFANIYK